jgi:hypothetical protein
MDKSRFQVSTFISGIIILACLFAAIAYLPAAWALDVLKTLLLAAAGVLLVKSGNTTS